MIIVLQKCLNSKFLILFFALLYFSSCKSSKSISTLNTNSTPTKKIEEKYAVLLNTDKKQITNIRLYQLIDEWSGTPYKYGGNTKAGVDCSNFTTIVCSEIYNKNVAGSSASIYNQCKEIPKNDFKEGDLVFFKIESQTISHVGIYLINNKFVHATTKKGVMINDLDETYYKKYFYKARRIN